MTSKQRAHLRSLAHPLKPLVHLGKEGLTEAAVRSMADAFNTRELLKVKVLENAPFTARELAAEVEAHLEGVQVVQVMGNVVTLYRPHPTQPKIVLG